MNDTALDYSRYFWRGEKVVLRPLRVEDAELAFGSMLDTPSRQFLQLGTELPTSMEQEKEIVAEFTGCKEHEGARVFAVENLNGDTVGMISLHSEDQKNGRFSFGISVYRPYRGRGYAHDAVRILLRYGFMERRHQKCNSACTHTNEASLRLHRKLGFVEEGRRRRQWFFDGQHHDDILFGMTMEEFEALSDRE